MVVFIKALAGFNNIIYAILMLEVVNREDFYLVILWKVLQFLTQNN